jgi:hypothetical protein
MANTTFTGPVNSLNGFVGGTASAPITVTTATNINSSYATSSATTGDTRLSYNRLTLTSTGSGETLRALTRVTGANAATGGTVNGAHISLSVNTGGTISGAGNALRVTLGAAAGVATGGTVAALQVDSDLNATATVPASASFIRVTNTNTTKLSNLLNMPAPAVGGVLATVVGSPAQTHTIKFVDSAGVNYYMMVSTTA